MVALAVCEGSWVHGAREPPLSRLGGERPGQSILSDGRAAAGDPPGLCEATLGDLWAGQRLPASALVTRQGVPVRVLHPGRRGRGAGPDFRDAVIATPSGRLLRGDVELHVRAGDFRVHGHHRDRRYEGVVLHVVFEDDVGEDTCLANGREAPVVTLAPWTRRRAHELAGWLAGPALWREPCHDAVSRLGLDRVVSTLETLGERRFREREAVLVDEVGTRGPGEALYRALLAGLGYGGDRPLLETVSLNLSWRELASRLASVPGDEREVLAEALLLGAARLLPWQRGDDAIDSREARWEEHLRRVEWRFERLGEPPAAAPPSSRRPVNHPARRLAGLAQLLARHRLLLDDVAPPRESSEGGASSLIEAWTAPARGYWRKHLAPGLPTRRTPGALVGRDRAIELLVNAVLPWAAARAEDEGSPEQGAGVRAAFSRLPRPGRYGLLASLEANLKVGGEPLRLNARRQQGMLALHKMECTQGGCGRCPLS